MVYCVDLLQQAVQSCRWIFLGVELPTSLDSDRSRMEFMKVNHFVGSLPIVFLIEMSEYWRSRRITLMQMVISTSFMAIENSRGKMEPYKLWRVLTGLRLTSFLCRAAASFFPPFLVVVHSAGRNVASWSTNHERSEWCRFRPLERRSKKLALRIFWTCKPHPSYVGHVCFSYSGGFALLKWWPGTTWHWQRQIRSRRSIDALADKNWKVEKGSEAGQ